MKAAKAGASLAIQGMWNRNPHGIALRIGRRPLRGFFRYAFTRIEKCCIQTS